MKEFSDNLEKKLYLEEEKSGFESYTLQNDAKLDLSADARIFVEKLGKMTK